MHYWASKNTGNAEFEKLAKEGINRVPSHQIVDIPFVVGK